MKSLVIVFIFAVVIIIEVKTLIKNHKKGEAVVVLILYSIGFILSFLLAEDVRIPNPNRGIMYLIKQIPFLK